MSGQLRFPHIGIPFRGVARGGGAELLDGLVDRLGGALIGALGIVLAANLKRQSAGRSIVLAT